MLLAVLLCAYLLEALKTVYVLKSFGNIFGETYRTCASIAECSRHHSVTQNSHQTFKHSLWVHAVIGVADECLVLV